MRAELRIDAHQHFWRYDPDQYPWIPAGSRLQRDWLPSDLALLQQRTGLAGSLAVQARQTLGETEWLLGLSDADPRILGVVGWVDLRDPHVDRVLARLARHPRMVGVRHVVQDEPDDAFLLRPEVLEGLARVAEVDLAYDLLVFPRQLPAALAVAERLPRLRLILDHLGKPAIRRQEREPWATHVRTLARHPNVWCKVSGLVTEADHAAWQPPDLRPFLDVAFEAFGPERLMFGSDWPVCLLAADYECVVALIEDYTRPFDAGTRQAIFGGNALRCYLQKARVA